MLASIAALAVSFLSSCAGHEHTCARGGAVWDLGSAWREMTPTRERVCLNGLWRWQPAQPADAAVPAGGWGWFKVPGPWPGITDYMQKDCQTLYPNPAWKTTLMSAVKAAWYEREFTVPANWQGRRIVIRAAYVNSLATAYVDGRPVGTISFPEGEVNLTSAAKPGTTHLLSIEVVALPLKGVIQAYIDTNSAKTMAATVARRGLCGDVFLVGEPKGARIDDVKVVPSVQHWSLTVSARLANLGSGRPYRLRAEIFDHGKLAESFSSDEVTTGQLERGRFSFTKPWHPAKLWDLNTPENQYDLRLTLLEGDKTLDLQAPKRFGFRELWIKGRDFMLNGSRVFWSCVPIDNAAIGAGSASYDGARETLRRLKSFGINMVYTHNYDTNPGSFLAFDEMLRAADDEGVLVSLTQPHFGDYDWSSPTADSTNGYARHAAFFACVAGSHPSVIAYATSHNACGYNEDTNPEMMDGLSAPRDSWALNNVKKALRAEAIIHAIDPSRLVYHHSGGNLGSMFTVNFYLNWAPMQEVDDWFQHWATAGVKPLVTVEYGVPFSWDWSMYRGWYNGQRSFGSAEVPWEYTMAEWNAQFLGDRAYNVSDPEKQNLRWEANKFRTTAGWFRWDYPFPMGSTNPGFGAQQEVWANYTTDNWRAFRTWGLSGISPWETYGTFWRLRDGFHPMRVDLATDWAKLQHPGYSPDYLDQRFERRDTAYVESDWIPTTGGLSLIRNNRPLLAYIGGKPGAFTEKGHNFVPGQRIEKQIIVVNNSRELATCDVEWSLNLPTAVRGHLRFRVETGQISQNPISFRLPPNISPGTYKLDATVEFLKREVQADEFDIRVLPPMPAVSELSRLAVYDPAGETTRRLARFGFQGTPVGPGADLSKFNTVIVGKGALTVDGPGLELSRVREGQKVIVFEQTSEVLEKRLGFRVEEYGLRHVFPRVSNSPALAGLDTEALRDWRGESTLVPPRRSVELEPNVYNGAPTVVQTGIRQPRVWRCGNRGNVASVLIEKPGCGDFLPLVDGGFGLQYCPLLEFREGQGMILFCQMDVTGRTETDPAADRLTANLLNYVANWQPGPDRRLIYHGGAEGRSHLEAAGYKLAADDAKSDGGQEFAGLLSPTQAAPPPTNIVPKALLMVGMDNPSPSKVIVRNFSPYSFKTEQKEYIIAPAIPGTPAFAGIGRGDVFNRDPRNLPVFRDGGVLASTHNGVYAYDQLVPWSFDLNHQNTRRVFRRASFALARILGNLGVHGSTPLLERFAKPASPGEARYLKGLYLDKPLLEDAPYRFFGWLLTTRLRQIVPFLLRVDVCATWRRKGTV